MSVFLKVKGIICLIFAVATLIISGAFGVFKRGIVVDAGGFATDTVGEDMELILRIHRKMKEQRREYRVVFVPDPVCWTEAPESVKVLMRQRNRWHRGLVQTLGALEDDRAPAVRGVVGNPQPVLRSEEQVSVLDQARDHREVGALVAPDRVELRPDPGQSAPSLSTSWSEK